MMVLLNILLLVTMSTFPVPLNAREQSEAIFQLPSERGPASLPVPNSTRSFWIDTPNANPHAIDGSEGPLTADADICIIGSGITGVSAAYHLSQVLAKSNASPKPLKAVILEARDFCSGATGRNGGHLAPHAFSGFRKLSEKYGQDEALRGVAMEFYTASEIVKIIKDNRKESEVDLVDGGRVELLFTENEVINEKANYEAAKAAGANVSGVQWLEKDEVKARYGASYPGVHMSSHNLWPLKTVALLYELAASSLSLDLTLHTRTPVTSVSPLGAAGATSRRWNVNTARGAIACSYVLHATNAYASHLLPYLQGPAGIVPTRGQIIAVRANAPEEKVTKSGYVGNEGLEYWFPRPVETNETSPLVLLGGGREVAPRHEFDEVDDSVINTEVGAALRKFLPSVFPGLYKAGKEPEMEWTGVMGFTTSGDPFVGPVVNPAIPGSAETYRGQYIAAGYSGHGMPRAYACAAAVAQMVVADITGQSWTPPEWLPQHYITASL